jgi:hypothetical protein
MLADDLVALGNQLHARYVAAQHGTRKGAAVPEGCPAGVPIPATVAASRKRLDAALDALRAATALRHEGVEPSPDSNDRPSATAASRSAWQAFNAWLGAWTLFADDGQSPSGVDAEGLFNRLFPAPDGLRFITWRSRRQWSAMQVRMDVLANEEVVATVTALGGARLLAALISTHDAFGRAFAFTAAKGVSVASPAVVLPQFIAAKVALRDYVVKVTGSADPDLANSEALAAWLMGPFRDMLAEFAAQAAPRPRTAPAPDAPTT